MRTRHLSALAAVLLLAACGTNATTGEPEPTTPTPVASQAAEEPTEEPTTPEPTTEEPKAAPPECETGEADTPLGEAVYAADIPPTVSVLTVEELRPDSDEDQSLKWVVVQLCSGNLTEDEHRTVATDLAIAARDADGGGDEIWRMSVQLYTPGMEGMEQVRTLIVEDFGVFTWDRSAGRPPETIWEDPTA